MKDLAELKWVCPVCGHEDSFHVHRSDVRLLGQTNADKIRAMSDEELAGFLNTINNCTCSFAMGKSPCDANDCPCWLDWLKQGVAE